MTGIVIPPLEINSILDIIVTSFRAQYGKTIDPATLSYSFITPRTDTQLCFEAVTTIPGKLLRIRLYIERFSLLTNLSAFALEQLDGVPNAAGAELVYVSQGTLSSSVFKGMKKAVISSPTIIINPFAFELEDGSGYFELEDGTGLMELETAP